MFEEFSTISVHRYNYFLHSIISSLSYSVSYLQAIHDTLIISLIYAAISSHQIRTK